MIQSTPARAAGRAITGAVALITLIACGDPKEAASGFTPDDFRKLAWLEGSWHGRSAAGTSFFESYRVVDDSTMRVDGFGADSTFTAQKDTMMIALRNGVVIDSSAGYPVWRAAKLDSTSVDFQSSRDPRNHFTWTRRGPDAWTVRLHNIRNDGTEQVTEYSMQRVKR